MRILTASLLALTIHVISASAQALAVKSLHSTAPDSVPPIEDTRRFEEWLNRNIPSFVAQVSADSTSDLIEWAREKRTPIVFYNILGQRILTVGSDGFVYSPEGRRLQSKRMAPGVYLVAMDAPKGRKRLFRIIVIP
jgi:hypothetical protein